MGPRGTSLQKKIQLRAEEIPAPLQGDPCWQTLLESVIKLNCWTILSTLFMGANKDNGSLDYCTVFSPVHSPLSFSLAYSQASLNTIPDICYNISASDQLPHWLGDSKELSFHTKEWTFYTPVLVWMT